MDEGPTLMTSFNFYYLLKGLMSKYSHIGGKYFNIWHWGHNLIYNNPLGNQIYDWSDVEMQC